MAPAANSLAFTTTAQVVLAGAEHAARLMLSEPEAHPPERLVGFAEDLLGLFG